jgi:glycosyltransferase involved in cell wall biosynthesis
MPNAPSDPAWQPGAAPVAVVMITLNEAHNMEEVLDNLRGWAQEVFVVDSYSRDATVDIALSRGVHVVQRQFRGFGDQWNFALSQLPITAPWTMKLDPDERVSDALKAEILDACRTSAHEAYRVNIRLFFMQRALPVRLSLLRLWRSGKATFSNVLVNEHATITGTTGELSADVEHHDSPDLHHWLEKQNAYTTGEAIAAYEGRPLSARPRLFGSRIERRMWIKQNYRRFPLRYLVLFLHHYLVQGAWRAGWVGYAWSRLRSDVYRLLEYKLREIQITGRLPVKRVSGPGEPDPRVPQY